MSAAEASLRKFLGRPLATERSQPQTPAANNPAAALPLTFGVELEFILAVQNEKFAAPAFSWLYAPIQASSGQNELEKTQLRTLPRKDSSLLSRAERQHRVYPMLTWASRILQKHGLDHVVATGKLTDVQRWGIVPECTANAEGWNELITKLPDRVRTATLEEWNAKGVEMVSRVLKAPDHNQTRYMHSDPALEEIGMYLKAVNGAYNTPWGAFVNKTCGLHMHVGLDPRLSNAGVLPLDLLQHLSYILVQFETSISALHPRGRRALADTRFGAGSMLGSNLMGIRQARHICNMVPLPLLEQIQDRIFSEDMSIEELAILMGQTMGPGVPPARGFTGRYKFVNFERLVGDPAENGAKTIEFRQHDGSLDADEIGRWVMFVTRLVRAAERLAASSKPASPDSPSAMSRQRVLEIYMKLPFARKQGSKYKLRCQKQTDEYERLFDLVDMPRLERDYWMGKYKLYNPEEVLADDELLSISQDDCPVCADERNTSLLQASAVTPTRSPALARNPEGPTTPESSIPVEEVERLRVIWGIRRSAAVGGRSDDERDENSPPFRAGIGRKTTNSDFLNQDVAELGEKQEALRLSDTVGWSSSSKRRSAGHDGPSCKRRIS